MNQQIDTLKVFSNNNFIPSKLVYLISLLTSVVFICNFLLYKELQISVYFGFGMIFSLLWMNLRYIDDSRHIDISGVSKLTMYTLFLSIALVYYFLFINDISLNSFFLIYLVISIISMISSLYLLIKK